MLSYSTTIASANNNMRRHTGLSVLMAQWAYRLSVDPVLRGWSTRPPKRLYSDISNLTAWRFNDYSNTTRWTPHRDLYLCHGPMVRQQLKRVFLWAREGHCTAPGHLTDRWHCHRYEVPSRRCDWDDRTEKHWKWLCWPTNLNCLFCEYLYAAKYTSFKLIALLSH